MTKKSDLATTIFNYHTPEFFINMKDIPPPKSELRGAFVSEEKRKCREGINVNGVFIPGCLYFHLNYYHLQGDNLLTGRKEIMLPRLRDNEWIIFNDYDECKKKKIIYPLFGARQISKSETETSLCLGEICLFKETEAMGIFSNSPDRDTFTKKLSTAITHGESFIIVPNIDKDLSKDEIRFGFTRPDNTTDIRARLYIYNTQEGKKIQIGSGKSISFLLFDEIGKSNFKQVYDVIEPALLSDTGDLRCAPIFAFTGGEVDKSRDAENLVKNPTERQFKTEYFDVDLNDTRIIGGRLLDGLYRKDCKEEVRFADYIGKTTNTWLDNTIIYVSNKEKALEKINLERDEAEKSNDAMSLTLKKIFFPLSLSDIFLTESNNNFPLELIRPLIAELRHKYEPYCVDLYRDNTGKVKAKESFLKPISKFPVNQKDFKEAPFVIYEHPIEGLPFATYLAGGDPYNENESSDKINSLGTWYIFKRMYDPMGEFQDSIVASYAGKFKDIELFHEFCLMATEYYNAIALPENENKALIQHFFHKKKGHLLADSFELAKAINPNTKSVRLKGLSASTKNQQEYMNAMVEYTKKETILYDHDGNEIKTYGVYRIKDDMLLEEMQKYRSKPSSSKGIHDGNYDRIVAFGHCLLLARHFDIKYPITEYTRPSENKNEGNQKRTHIKTVFGDISNKTYSPFGKSKPIKNSGRSQFI